MSRSRVITVHGWVPIVYPRVPRVRFQNPVGGRARLRSPIDVALPLNVSTSCRESAGALRQGVRSCRAWRQHQVRDFKWGACLTFSEAKAVADRSGPSLRRLIAQQARDGVPEVDIVAHSLGTRLVYMALNRKWPPSWPRIRNVYLMGGAFQAFRSWWRIADQVSGHVYNFSSSHDAVLRYAYHLYINRNGRPIGLPNDAPSARSERGILTRLRKVVNLNVSNTVAGHSGYAENLDQLVRWAHRLGAKRDALPRDGTWRDDFYWAPAPSFSLRGRYRTSRGAYVEIVQRALSAETPRLMPVGAIDGVWGPRTKRAVHDFQRSRGLRADGYVGADTWEHLVGKPARLR